LTRHLQEPFRRSKPAQRFDQLNADGSILLNDYWY